MHTRLPVSFGSVTLAGARVRLVPVSDQYAEVIFREFTDEITRYMMPATPTHIDQVRDFIAASRKNMDDHDDLVFAILDKSTDDFLGVCALHGKRSPSEPILGIWLKKGAHGNRYGQEAMKLLADWSRQHLIFDFMVYPCDRDNIPSRKIAEFLNGTVFRTAEVTSLSGRVLNEVAYKIV